MSDTNKEENKKYRSTKDQRGPSALGYSCPCRYSLPEQMHLVAEFSAHKIVPERIAYRTGIDIDFIRALQDGCYEPERYQALSNFYRAKRRDERLQKSLRKNGMEQSQLQEKIIEEYRKDIKKAK